MKDQTTQLSNLHLYTHTQKKRKIMLSSWQYEVKNYVKKPEIYLFFSFSIKNSQIAGVNQFRYFVHIIFKLMFMEACKRKGKALTYHYKTLCSNVVSDLNLAPSSLFLTVQHPRHLQTYLFHCFKGLMCFIYVVIFCL